MLRCFSNFATFLSISLEHFLEQKPLISEELYVEYKVSYLCTFQVYNYTDQVNS